MILYLKDLDELAERQREADEYLESMEKATEKCEEANSQAKHLISGMAVFSPSLFQSWMQ